MNQPMGPKRKPDLAEVEKPGGGAAANRVAPRKPDTARPLHEGGLYVYQRRKIRDAAGTRTVWVVQAYAEPADDYVDVWVFGADSIGRADAHAAVLELYRHGPDEIRSFQNLVDAHRVCAWFADVRYGTASGRDPGPPPVLRGGKDKPERPR